MDAKCIKQYTKITIQLVSVNILHSIHILFELKVAGFNCLWVYFSHLIKYMEILILKNLCKSKKIEPPAHKL